MKSTRPRRYSAAGSPYEKKVQDLGRAFLRLFFRLLYNNLAWCYDGVAWLVSLGHWKDWGRTTLPHLRGGRILELGHGPGHLLLALGKQGFAPVGLDVSVQMGRQAQRRLRKTDVSVPLVRARAQALPFRNGSFDSSVATFPTTFIVDPRTLREVTRTLGPVGRLVIALEAHFDGQGLLAILLTWLYRATGQAKGFPGAFVSCLEELGLSARVVRERVDQTSVLLVVAERR